MIHPFILCNKSPLQLTLERVAQVNGRVAAPPVKV